MLKISSLNVNGIRAAHRHGFTDWIDETDPDIICLQELRALEHQVPGPIKKLDYHEAYHTAEKKGYSGVGILSKEEPINVEAGIGVDWIDSEGRIIKAEFEDLIVFSIYAPSGTTGDERQDLKMEFLDYFLPFAQKYLSHDKPVIFSGDYNICHKPIDIHNPSAIKTLQDFCQKNVNGSHKCCKPALRMSIEAYTKAKKISTAGGVTVLHPKNETKAGESTIT